MLKHGNRGTDSFVARSALTITAADPLPPQSSGRESFTETDPDFVATTPLEGRQNALGVPEHIGYTFVVSSFATDFRVEYAIQPVLLIFDVFGESRPGEGAITPVLEVEANDGDVTIVDLPTLYAANGAQIINQSTGIDPRTLCTNTRGSVAN
ncbi:MAG: hypothetical protein AAGJ50_14080 [Pseudomonadota bacterium]